MVCRWVFNHHAVGRSLLWLKADNTSAKMRRTQTQTQLLLHHETHEAVKMLHQTVLEQSNGAVSPSDKQSEFHLHCLLSAHLGSLSLSLVSWHLLYSFICRSCWGEVQDRCQQTEAPSINGGQHGALLWSSHNLF